MLRPTAISVTVQKDYTLKVIFDNGETKTLTGVILHTHTLISLKGNPTSSKTYSVNTVVTIAADRETKNFKGVKDAEET